ncbi:MAG: hypothetical protein P1V51_07465 [Deltaproteobacteria bacterium]|nr:hypothetical protein [Deltaproteobacteria bacterium]
MSPALRWVQHGANLSVTATGLVYLWMKFLLEPADEWAVVNHPWQPTLQHLHVLAAPLLVFTFGLLFQVHLAARLRLGPAGRLTGLGLASTFVAMAASGYLLQISVAEGWRAAFSWMHLGSGGLWVALSVAHTLVALRVRRSRRAMERILQARLSTLEG